jgi:sialate O-acetylesterase
MKFQNAHIFAINKLMFLLFLCFFYLNIQGQNKESALKFADPLTSNMVIQQNQAFKVWGQSKPGKEVSIQADWTSDVKVIADEKGNFMGIVPVYEITKGDFTKHNLKIKSGEETVVLDNILIGELWICSGQSNMQFGMDEVLNAEVEILKADNPNIRLFNTGLNFSNEPIMNVSGSWKECTPETVRKFSAVGYYFAKNLYDKLNIPVGILFTGIGASAAQAYVPRAVLAADPVLDSVYLQPYLKSDRSKEKVDGGFSFEKVTRPFLLYNALINPFKNLSVKGIIWYQGESNRDEREEYTQLMYKMIESWRDAFGQGNLPFYFVQVAPYFYDIEDPTLADYAFFREAQEKITTLDHTAMVLTMDVGEARNLHPVNKKPVGERLARTALNRNYNYLDMAYKGPHFESVQFHNSAAMVYFEPETVERGLKTNDGKSPQFFELAGEDQKFYPANARIEGRQIIVTSEKVEKPVAIRYAFTNYPVTNLENGEELPAVPFRSDSWDEPKISK